MRTKEYGAWPTRNILSGGQKQSFDEYNREYKKVRYTSAEEYASRNVKEYTHYPEYKDLTADDDDNQQQGGSAARTSNAAGKRQRIMQQVVCLVAGSTIIVSSYQAMTARQAEAEPIIPPPAIVQEDGKEDVTDNQVVPDEPVTKEEETTEPTVIPGVSAKWIWNNDYTAAVRLYDSEGKLISETPADVSTSTTAPTCNKQGRKTYTAKADVDGKVYTDSRTETLNALGHSFDDGEEVVLDNGQSGMVFECERCHEKFTIATGSSENDD